MHKKKKICETPISFLCVYLIELCNFVEFDNVEKTYNMLKYLEKTQENAKAKRKVGEAILDFLIIYGTKEEANKYLEKFDYFSYMKEEIQLYLDPEKHIFNYVMNRSTYKLKQNKIFLSAPKTTEKWFIKFFVNVVFLLKEKGINLLDLWLGKCAYHELKFSYVIKEINNDFLIEKEFKEDDYLIMDIKKDAFKILGKDSCGDEIDPGACIFERSYIITYLVKAFENEIRRQLGMRQIKVSTDEIQTMLNRVSATNKKHVMLNEIIDFYNSKEFDDCLKENLQWFKNDFEKEKENNNSLIKYIYCTVKFDGNNYKYSYITDDDDIVIGDSVVVPVGPYDIESIAVVYEKNIYTELNAPFPPSKTKKIIRKHV